MPKYKFVATDIEWDTDDETPDLPKVVKGVVVARDREHAHDLVSDLLSDDYGWCHNGFDVVMERQPKLDKPDEYTIVKVITPEGKVIFGVMNEKHHRKVF